MPFIPRKILGFFKTSYRHLSPLIFLSFLTSLLFAPTCITISGSCTVQTVATDYFQRTTWGKGFSRWGRRLKISPVIGTFLGSCRTDQIVTILWGWTSWITPSPLRGIPNHPVSWRAACFHNYCGSRLMIFKTTRELGREGWDEDKLKNHKVYCSYRDSTIFLEYVFLKLL